ncbi:MAG: hypothetical protein ACLFS3_02120 [Candidatus Aenigmatarchaeota archaeon]
MSFIREKTINGNQYLYLVKSVRNGDQVRQKVLKYIGPVGKVSQEEIKKIKKNS